MSTEAIARLERLVLEAEWDLFMRVTAGLFGPCWLAGASALLSLNDAAEL